MHSVNNKNMYANYVAALQAMKQPQSGSGISPEKITDAISPEKGESRTTFKVSNVGSAIASGCGRLASLLASGVLAAVLGLGKLAFGCTRIFNPHSV